MKRYWRWAIFLPLAFVACMVMAAAIVVGWTGAALERLGKALQRVGWWTHDAADGRMLRLSKALRAPARSPRPARPTKLATAKAK